MCKASLEADAASAKSCFITKLLQQYVRSDAQEAFGPEDATGNPMLSLAELDKRLKRAIVREKGLDSICASMMWIIMNDAHLDPLTRACFELALQIYPTKFEQTVVRLQRQLEKASRMTSAPSPEVVARIRLNTPAGKDTASKETQLNTATAQPPASVVATQVLDVLADNNHTPRRSSPKTSNGNAPAPLLAMMAQPAPAAALGGSGKAGSGLLTMLHAGGSGVFKLADAAQRAPVPLSEIEGSQSRSSTTSSSGGGRSYAAGSILLAMLHGGGKSVVALPTAAGRVPVTLADIECEHSSLKATNPSCTASTQCDADGRPPVASEPGVQQGCEAQAAAGRRQAPANAASNLIASSEPLASMQHTQQRRAVLKECAEAAAQQAAAAAAASQQAAALAAEKMAEYVKARKAADMWAGRVDEPSQTCPVTGFNCAAHNQRWHTELSELFIDEAMSASKAAKQANAEFIRARREANTAAWALAEAERRAIFRL